jgi:hypothetical protein
MGEDDIAARLRALATDDKRRPETARLRDVFNDVEATLKAGVSQADVLAELHKAGFTMTMASFKSALQRIRKKQTQPAKPAAKFGHDQAQPASQPAQAPQEEPAKDPQARITNPADIRKSRRREIDLDDLSDKE